MQAQFTIHHSGELKPAEARPVEIWVGHEVQVRTIQRPTRVDGLTIVSSDGVSARRFDPQPLSLRAMARAAIRAGNRMKGPLALDGAFYDTRFASPNNMGHLLVEILPVCLTIKRHLGEDVTFVVQPIGDRFRELIAAFDLKIVSTDRAVSGRKIETFFRRELSEYPTHTLIEVPKASILDDVYAGISDRFPPIEGFDRIFLTRRDQRALLNNVAVDTFLADRGYRPVFMEDHDIPTQIRIGLSARDVVALHGAAMGYLRLNPHLNSVVEILPPSVYHNFFPLALGPRTNRYKQIVPSFDRDIQFAGWDRIWAAKNTPFHVDTEQLERALADFVETSPVAAAAA